MGPNAFLFLCCEYVLLSWVKQNKFPAPTTFIYNLVLKQ